MDIIHQKGANLKSLKEPWLDTTTPQGKLLFTTFAGISQFDRDLISQRTKEGLSIARVRGRKGGRPGKPLKDIEPALKCTTVKIIRLGKYQRQPDSAKLAYIDM